MRETSARVLAAALMTGAIAFALAMPALFGTSARDAARTLTSPPSSLQRSVQMVASTPPRPPLHATRKLEPTRTIARAVPVAVGSAFGRQPNSTGGRTSILKPASQPAPRPTPQPVPANETRTLASDTSAAPTAVSSASQTASVSRKGKGKGRDRRKDRGNPAPSESQPAAAAPPPPESEPPKSAGPKDHGQDHDKVKGGNDKGHDD
jgi:hypothetical protein